MAPPEHTSPAVRHPVAPVEPATWQRPTVAPDALLHLPAQHSRSVVQASPDCVQYEGAAQIPLLQKLEQQSLCALQGLPEVLQPASGVHLPDPHLPPQHSPSLVHAALSAMHCVPEQLPLTQENVQHSGPAVHGAPAPLHDVPLLAQACVAGSHCSVQHWLLSVHDLPISEQFAAPPAPVPPTALPPVPAPPTDESLPPLPPDELPPVLLSVSRVSPPHAANPAPTAMTIPSKIAVRFITRASCLPISIRRGSARGNELAERFTHTVR
jgi:hypothetical protein